MPQVDLSPLFKPPSQGGPSRKDRSSLPEWTDPWSSKPAQSTSRFKVTIAQLTNVAFVLAACLGALVSALYFIKGGELFQEVATWPRELFHGRPAIRTTATIQATAGNDTVKDEAGDPFSSTAKLLKLNSAAPSFQPNGHASSMFGPSGNGLNHLNMPAPGGDTLTRGLMQGTATANATAGGTSAHAAAPQTPAANVSAKPGVQLKTATARATTPKSSLNGSSSSQKILKSAKQAKSAVHRGTSQTISTGNHNATTSTHIGQSAASLRSIGPAGHPFGGGAGGMGAGHSVGRAGGR